MFQHLQVFSACCVMLAHGAGEVGYLSGPLGAIWHIVNEGEGEGAGLYYQSNNVEGAGARLDAGYGPVALTNVKGQGGVDCWAMWAYERLKNR